jgi:uncharacterized radical SAM superfamily Fe-S cluster-containing enzyme
LRERKLSNFSGIPYDGIKTHVVTNHSNNATFYLFFVDEENILIPIDRIEEFKDKLKSFLNTEYPKGENNG